MASSAVAAITLATCTMPFLAIGVLPWAVSCQEWNGVPTAQVAPSACTSGTTQDTSPTSVEPIIGTPVWPSGRIASASGSSRRIGRPAFL